MSTITREFAQDIIRGHGYGVAPSAVEELARIALASLEAEPVIIVGDDGGDALAYRRLIQTFAPGTKLYISPPVPVSVPDEATPENIEILASTFAPRGVTYQWDKDECNAAADSWNACRAAMLQGADRPQNEPQNIPENIPATQFKPVADLYGLTSPTGGETSFTFDAVEARDFIDGGWSCQEYVELGRYQEALTDHSEDKLAMVDHSGDSNNMVEPVTTACKLRDAVEIIRNSGIAIDAEKILAERDALNSPVVHDGWVACSERMPEVGSTIMVFMDKPQHSATDYAITTFDKYGFSRAKVTHWQPLPAAPRQEAE